MVLVQRLFSYYTVVVVGIPKPDRANRFYTELDCMDLKIRN
jgi:hypothetical protein